MIDRAFAIWSFALSVFAIFAPKLFPNMRKSTAYAFTGISIILCVIGIAVLFYPAGSPSAGSFVNNGINTNNQSGGSNTINNGPPQNDRSFYQKGQRVGEMDNQAIIDPVNLTVTFDVMGVKTPYDDSEPMEFRNYIIKCPVKGRPEAVEFLKKIQGPVICAIVGSK